MKIVLSKRILRKELGPKPKEDDLLIIRKSYEKGIFNTIKGEALPVGTRIIKIYATTVDGARRVVFLQDAQSGDVFFLFLRSKNDKIGSNITIQNPEFKKKLQEYLKILLEDLGKNDFEVIEIS